MLPNRLTRYVLWELFTPTMLGLSLYTLVLMMNHFFLVAEKALSKSLPWELSAKLFFTGIPNLLILSIPMAVLLGTLIAVGRLSSDQEWVAMQGAGQGPTRLLRPVVIHGLVASLVTFFIYAEVSPRANYALRNLRGELLLASHLATDLRPRVFYDDIPGAVLFVEDIRGGTSERLRGVILFRRKSSDDPRDRLFLARAGDLYPASDGSGDLLLELFDGVAHTYVSDSPETYHPSNFGVLEERLSAAAYLQALLDPPEKGVQDFDPRELLAELGQARAAESELSAAMDRVEGERPAGLVVAQHRLRRIIVEIHQRLALPLASLFLAILALPLGVTHVRSGKGAGFALSLLVILVYWASFTFARNQSLAGNLDPALGPWVGNLIVLPWSLWALRRMRHPPSDSRGWVSGGLSGLLHLVRRLRRGLARGGAGGSAALDLPSGDPDLQSLAGTPARFVSRIDQLIGMQYLQVLGGSLVSAYLIFALVESKRLMDGLLRHDQSFSLMFEYFKYFGPGMLNIVLPISCLVGAVVAFTILDRRGEVTAIKAAGISARRMTFAVLALTLAACAMLFLVDDRIAPPANRKAQSIRDEILRRAPRSYGTSAAGRWSLGPDGSHLYHYRVYDPDLNAFQGLSVFTIDRSFPRIVDHRYCETATWFGGRWVVEGGWFRTFPRDGTAFEFEDGTSKVELAMAPPAEFESRQFSLASKSSDLPEQLTLAELSRQLALLGESGYDTTKLRVAYHSKWARSMTPFVMVLLGLPFAFRVGRRGSLYGVGVALVLILIYWATLAIFRAVGLEGLLDPILAAWGPNILFALLGTYLMLYIRT